MTAKNTTPGKALALKLNAYHETSPYKFLSFAVKEISDVKEELDKLVKIWSSGNEQKAREWFVKSEIKEKSSIIYTAFRDRLVSYRFFMLGHVGRGVFDKMMEDLEIIKRMHKESYRNANVNIFIPAHVSSTSGERVYLARTSMKTFIEEATFILTRRG